MKTHKAGPVIVQLLPVSPVHERPTWLTKLSISVKDSSMHPSISLLFYIFYMNTCWVPHLKMIPKHFTTATIALLPASELTHCAWVICDCEWVTSFTQHVPNIPPKWLQCCLVVIWLVPHETVAVPVQVLCTPNKPCTSLECHYWKPHTKGARV